jgi:hypothetical protein
VCGAAWACGGRRHAAPGGRQDSWDASASKRPNAPTGASRDLSFRCPRETALRSPYYWVTKEGGSSRSGTSSVTRSRTRWSTAVRMRLCGATRASRPEQSVGQLNARLRALRPLPKARVLALRPPKTLPLLEGCTARTLPLVEVQQLRPPGSRWGACDRAWREADERRDPPAHRLHGHADTEFGPLSFHHAGTPAAHRRVGRMSVGPRAAAHGG